MRVRICVCGLLDTCIESNNPGCVRPLALALPLSDECSALTSAGVVTLMNPGLEELSALLEQ